MSRLFVCGDTHGDIDIGKLNTKNFPESKQLTSEDFVLICGDVAVCWDGAEFDRYIQKWYNEKPWTTIFCDGNHSNHSILDGLPVSEWHGGKVHKISDKIIHLMRGQVYDICGYSIFVMGGAPSTDRINRTEGISWWPREMPSDAEYQEGFKNLTAHGDKVDIIISHTAPDYYVDLLNCGFEHDKLTNYLEAVRFTTSWKKWFCGHFHRDGSPDNRFTFMYQKVIEVTPELMAQAPDPEQLAAALFVKAREENEKKEISSWE